MDYFVQHSKAKNKKTPILFLHGWGGSKESFAFVGKMVVDRDLWFVSFAGHGQTEEPKTPMSVEDFASQIVDFVKVHNLVGIDIVAHSFGGRVTLVLLSKYKEMFGRALLVGCAGLAPKRGIKFRLKILHFKVKKWLVLAKILPKRVLQNSGSADYRQLSPIMRETFKKIVNKNLKHYAKNIKSEVLLIWGKNDTETPLFMAKKLNKYIKNSELIVFDNASHFCFYEYPYQFALILEKFLV